MAVSRRFMLKTAAAVTASFLMKSRQAFASAPATERIPEKFHPIPFEAQTLSGLFAERMTTNVEKRLLEINEAALLSGFVNRTQAGDATSFNGEHAGKFLDAACNALRFRDNARLRPIMDRVTQGLIDSQERDGYLGTYPLAQRWGYWDVWVHKYTLIGLLSYYELTGKTPVLNACRKIGDLLERTYGDANGKRDIVAGLHLGMASTSVLEPLCRLYRVTGDARYLDFCRYIVRAYEQPNGPKIVSALLGHGSVYRTANGKVYEMLSNLNGLSDLYRITGDEQLLKAVLRGWSDIVRHQLLPTGSTSAKEHFQPPGQRLGLQSSDVGEMCATVTWLQLNARLLRLTGEARFGQEIERSVYNHLLAAQNAATGDIAYYTSLAGCKEHVHSILCCVSSGPRGISLIPELVWGLDGEAFVVNLFAQGSARFTMRGVPVKVKSSTGFPRDGQLSLEVQPAKAARFTLRIRVPEWARDFEARTSGEVFKGSPGQMLDITRVWKPSSRIDCGMTLVTQQESGGPSYPNLCVIQRGPQVLALEKAVNPGVPYLSRAGVKRDTAVSLNELTHAGWTGPVYALRGEPALALVPFADALDYRALISYADALRSDVPAITAYERAYVSTRDLKQLPTDRQVQYPENEETLSDENPLSYCIADPGVPTLLAQLEGKSASGDRSLPVWFGVMLRTPTTISRIVYRHGKVDAHGGWFDSSYGPPCVEILKVPPKPPGPFDDMGYLSPYEGRWELLGTLEGYPAFGPSAAPSLAEGQKFEIALPKSQTVYGIRVIGHAGGHYASCAELAAFA